MKGFGNNGLNSLGKNSSSEGLYESSDAVNWNPECNTNNLNNSNHQYLSANNSGHQPPYSNPQHSNSNNLNNSNQQHYSTNNSIHQHYNSNQQHSNLNQQLANYQHSNSNNQHSITNNTIQQHSKL